MALCLMKTAKYERAVQSCTKVIIFIFLTFLIIIIFFFLKKK